MKLHLGCSDNLLPGYLNVDSWAPPGATAENFLRADLRPRALGTTILGWPWEDSSIDEIKAHHVFEHIDGPGYEGNKGKIWCMNESWRVLKPGGILDFVVPCVRLTDGRVNEGADADPTHVSRWTPSDRYYFCKPWDAPDQERGRLGPAYGVKALFEEVEPLTLTDYGIPSERRSILTAKWRAVK